MRYIHYGASKYIPSIIGTEDRFARDDKPSGLWASPEDSKWGWKDWCMAEGYRLPALRKHFTFRLSKNAKVLHIHSLQEAAPYMEVKERFRSLTFYRLKMAEIYEKFDAMEVHVSEDWEGFRGNNVFWSWDVDSICVWNPNVIIAA